MLLNPTSTVNSLLVALACLVSALPAWACDEAIEVAQTVDLACGQSFQGVTPRRDTLVLRRIIATDPDACDTLYRISLDVHGNDYYTEVTVCAGSTHSVGDEIYDASGRYQTNIARPGQCDSVVYTDLTVLRPLESYFTVARCVGEVFEGITVTRDTLIVRRFTSTDGCDSTATYEIDVFSAEALAIAGPTRGCPDATITLEASAGYLNYRWSDGQRGRTASFRESGTVGLTVTGAAGCETTVFTPLTIEAPAFEVVTWPADCPEGGGQLEIADVIGGLPPYTFALDGATTDSITSGLPPDTYTVTVTDAAGCAATVTADLPEPRQRAIEIAGVPTESHPAGVPLLLSLTGADTAEIARVIWEGSGGFACAACAKTEVTPGGSGQLSVEVTTLGGCVLTARVQVALRKRNQTFVPTGFSPNGDGENDVLSVFSADPITAIEALTVHDRWGNALRIRGPDKETGALWDGTADGRAADPGVYVYQARVRFADGESRLIVGETTLVR